MATYKEIFGTNIEVLASDPANPVAGQVWYNSTSNVVKGQGVTTTGSWATGGNLNTGRMVLAGVGTQTATLVFGGGLPSPFKNETELYNGSTWTELNNLNTTRTSLEGAGDSTAALGFGGYNIPFIGATESWNGTSWTTVPATLNTARGSGGGAGAQTSAIFFGGIAPPPSAYTFRAETELYNGTSWTEVNNLNTTRYILGSAKNNADNTSALGYGGDTGAPNAVANTESWNGTSWTEVADLNTARNNLGGGGSVTSALGIGGTIPGVSPRTGATEIYNGTSWSEQGDLNTARNQMSGTGANNTAGLAAGGELASGSPAATAATEEFTGAGAPVTVTFTDS
jgi:hypothetical protein